MIEIPPKFAGRPPVNPASRQERTLLGREWQGAEGLAEDVRYYGQWMRDEAEKRIGYLYPKIEVTTGMAQDPTNPRPDLKKYVSQKLTVIAWIWARTVKSPNPAFAQVDVPLASTFMLCTKVGKEVYIKPVIEDGSYHFTVMIGKPKDAEGAKNGTKLSRGSFRCLLSDVPIPYEYVDDEANANRMGARLLAVVADGERERVYLQPTEAMEAVSREAKPTWKPDAPSRGTWASNAQGRHYGFRTFGDYFTPRQLVALTTFSELVQEARERVKFDTLTACLPSNKSSPAPDAKAATAYADAVSMYLGFGVDKMSDRHSTLTRWDPTPTASGIINTFSRQALPMTWDYAEGNPFSEASGNFEGGVGWIARIITGSLPVGIAGSACAADASAQSLSQDKIVSTDPPLLRQHRLCRPVRLLLRLAAPFAEAGFP